MGNVLFFFFQMKGSETSSDLDFSSRTSENRPVANSTFNETAKKPEVFASDEESDGQGSVPVKVGGVWKFS